MNNRERTLNILRFETVDRMPAVHFGYWKELLAEWAEQGHISRDLVDGWRDRTPADEALDKILGWDFNWVAGGTGRKANMRLFPTFEERVLETLPDGTQRIQTTNGTIERIKPGLNSIPSEDDYLLKDREAFETLFLPRMQFDLARINPEQYKNFNKERRWDIPVGLHVGSVIGEIRNYTTVLGMSYLMYDEDEELFADIVNTYADMQYKCVEAILETGAKFDFIHFWEDICFKNGPLLSPALFDELAAEHYKKRTALAAKYGIDIVSLDCDGVTEKLQQTWIENGVNVLFPIEVGVWGDQFAPARARFGKRQLGVGGMDKTCLRKDKAAVDEELKRMQQLVSLGGFIPCPDHRIMPGSKFELVQYYAEEIKKLKPFTKDE